ncbi:SCO7613 C-terminal domain-containing membrane protein [Bifidobacterium aesculapii]|uniref:SCO7613 C-terminal domain-containing membrane protein n=1 Tax=Bifidobacterium aesculapii TaxID=1329411 RepID=UPI0006E2E3B1|nr:hypothetical protein [Bifidobacterium aesculapii]
MQTLLLVLGVALVVIAVIAFAWFAYGLLGDAGRTACVATVGVVAVGVAIALTPRLRVTAEGLAWAGLIALAVGALLLSSMDDAPASDRIMALLAGLALAVVCATTLGIRFVPLPDGMPPLRAYSLYVTFALPLAAILMTYALPVLDFSVLFPLECVAGAAVAVTIAAFLPADPSRRAPDAEPIAALAVAGVLLAIATFGAYMAVDYHNPLWLVSLLIALTAVGWLLALVVLHVRRGTRSGRPLPTGLRFVPVTGLVWTIAASTTAIMRALPGSMALETGRMIAYLPTVVAGAAVVIAACAWPRREGGAAGANGAAGNGVAAGATGATGNVGAPGGSRRAQDVAGLSAAEHVAGALNGSTILVIMTCAEFSHEGWQALVTSMTAFVGLLAAAACAWARAARPIDKLVRMAVQPAQMRMQPAAYPAQAMAQPAQATAMPVQPIQPTQPTQPTQPIQTAWAPAQGPTQGPAQPAQSYPYTAAPQAAGAPHRTAAPQAAAAPLPGSVPQAGAQYPASMQVAVRRAAAGPDSAGVIVTIFAGLTTFALLTIAVLEPRPYAPADLLGGMVGVAALAVGVRWMLAWPALRSWQALWPALALLMIPPLLMSWTHPLSFPRALALFVIALAALLVGALRGLQAPLVSGAVVLVAHVLTVLWPWLAAFSQRFWWVWLLIGGVVLIVAAARYEASLKSVRSLATRISQLR